MSEIETARATSDRARGQLAAQIADAEAQFEHYRAERLRLWALAREHGWTYAQVGEAAGLGRDAVFVALKRAGLIETATARREGDDE